MLNRNLKMEVQCCYLFMVKWEKKRVRGLQSDSQLFSGTPPGPIINHLIPLESYVIQRFLYSEIFQLSFTQTGNGGILFLIPRQ